VSAPDRREVPITITVLVSTRDRHVLLERCLRAVLAAPVQPAELLVVDQSSGTRSRDIARRLREAGHTHLRWVRHTGSGLSASQNVGLYLARSSVVLVTDDDCVPAEDWVASAGRAFDQDPHLWLLGGRVEALPGTGLPVSLRTGSMAMALDAFTLPWDAGSGNNFAISAAALAAVGGNDERLGPGAPLKGGTDMDLFRRVLRTGARGRYDPAVLVHHERADTAERLARRVPYGYGTGACIGLWYRQGDPMACTVLKAWLRLRASRLRSALRGGDRLRVREEVLVLVGTARGLARGLIVRPSDPQVGSDARRDRDAGPDFSPVVPDACPPGEQSSAP